jgi:mono/diheme cytochrome c family protein
VFYRDVAGQEDSEYHGQQNPLQPTPVNRRDGQSLFEEHCVPCHGFNGMGPTQETAEQLHDFPPPPLLRSAAAIYPVDQDAYLLWTISEGGAQFGRPMPTFKHVLSRNDIWKIVVYLDSIRVTGNKIGTGLDPVQVRPR